MDEVEYLDIDAIDRGRHIGLAWVARRVVRGTTERV
jgi:hypothetical protein